MKRAVLSLLLITLALAVSSAHAQSADKVIERYKKASGGGAVKRVKSTLMSGSVRAGDQAAGRFVYQTSSPDRLRIDIEAGDLKVSESYNGKSAWRMDSRGLRTLLGEDAKRLRLEAILANTRLRDLSRHRIVPQLAARISVNGREANVVEFSKDDARTKLFFDASTNLLVKQERETGEGTREIFYADHRAVDGVMEPFSIKIKEGPRELLITIDRLEHNRAVEEAAFRYPQVEGARPMPDLESLMKSIVANQEKIEELRERYTFRETEIQRKLDGSGRVKETETRVYEVTPVAGQFVQRLVSVDGKELTAQEREKEDREVQKSVKEILERREKQKQKEEKQEQERRARGGSEEENPYENRSLTILSFLKLSKITSVRREMFRGHEVIAFDFEPVKGIKTKNRTESLISKLAGTMWVDESAQQIVRLEARLTDSFKFAGGLLASVSPSTAVALEQEKVGDEVWLPSYAEANISARVMLLAKFNRSVVTRYSDYKKYQIDSKYDLEKPKEPGKPEERLR